MKYECIFRLRGKQQEDFSAFPEIYQGVQVGLIKHRNWNGVSCLVVSGLVAVVIGTSLQNELQAFFCGDLATYLPRYNINHSTVRELAPATRRARPTSAD
jgi:hypothetical protein